MQFDHLSYGDFNPHLLYIGKKVPEVSGEDHSHDYLELTYIFVGEGKILHMKEKNIYCSRGIC